MEEHPRLQHGERISVLDVFGYPLAVCGGDQPEGCGPIAGGRPGPTRTGHTGQPRDRLVLEKLLQREVQAALPRFGEDLNAADRVPTQGEEVVVDTHSIDSENP